MRRIWIGIGGAVVLAGACNAGDKPRPRGEDLATSARPASLDATALAAAHDAGPVGEPLEAFPGFRHVARGQVADPELVMTLTARVKPVVRDCTDADAAALHVLRVDLDGTRPGTETVAVSLPHGVFALAGDRVLATSAEPLAPCEGSQTELQGIWAGQVVPDPEPELVVIDQFGGRNLGQTNLMVFKRRADRFVPIFAGVLAEYEGDDEQVRTIELRPDGTIAAETADGQVVHAWDPAGFRFVAAAPGR